MTVEEYEQLIAKLKQELAYAKKVEEEKKKEESKRLLWPAVAEQTARLRQFFSLRKISVSDQEFYDLMNVVDCLERRLRIVEPKYRYIPKASIRTGSRNIGKTKPRKKKYVKPDLFNTEKGA